MKRFFTQLLVCALVISLFAACAASTPNDATSENPAGTTGTTGTTDAAETGFTVTDVEGNEIYFEKQPETFVVANYIFNFLLIGGKDSLSKVVGLTRTDGRTPAMENIRSDRSLSRASGYQEHRRLS